MWLLFTITLLLTREVVANFEIYNRDGEKSITNDMSNIFSQQVLTSDLKTLLANIFNKEQTKSENEVTRKEEETIQADAEKERTKCIEENDSERAIMTDFEKKNEQEERNSKSTPWEGKRINSLLIPEFRPTVIIFDNWGRKRGIGISKRVPREGRKKLYPWNIVKPNHNMKFKRGSKSNSQKKIPFNSWGGKRVIDGLDFTTTLLNNSEQNERKVIFPKRKDQYEKSQEILMRKMEERRMPSVQKFESWDGKRSYGQEYLENIISSENNLKTIKLKIPHKRKNRTLRHRPSVFAPWGGKRSEEVASENPNDNSRLQPASFFVRKVFFPWGG